MCLQNTHQQNSEGTLYGKTRLLYKWAWVKPSTSKTLDVINPATEEAVAKISLGLKSMLIWR